MPNTIANLEAAAAAFDESYTDLVFVGGIFNADKGQITPASRLMYQWWREHHVNRQKCTVMTEESSLTTRQNILNISSEVLQGRVVAVSERYHLLGIRLLFLLLHHKWTRVVASTYRITNREKLERLIRLPRYILDPRGAGRLSQRKIKERGG